MEHQVIAVVILSCYLWKFRFNKDIKDKYRHKNFAYVCVCAHVLRDSMGGRASQRADWTSV